ncbi:MAG TPA: hypothetical protein VN457_07340 [Chlamydiales bacterium]|nr:hypothetical protein [Chlamydiales bacterium]
MAIPQTGTGSSDISLLIDAFKDIANDKSKFIKLYKKLDRLKDHDGQSLSLGIHNGSGVRVLLQNHKDVKLAVQAGKYDDAVQLVLKQLPESLFHVHSKGPDKTVRVFGNKQITQQLRDNKLVLTDKNKQKIDVAKDNVVTLKDGDLAQIAKVASEVLVIETAENAKSVAHAATPTKAPAPTKPANSSPVQTAPKAIETAAPSEATTAKKQAPTQSVAAATKEINAQEQTARKKDKAEAELVKEGEQADIVGDKERDMQTARLVDDKAALKAPTFPTPKEENNVT